jgi:hypothetical protein
MPGRGDGGGLRGPPEAEAYLGAFLRAGDLCLMMGAGNIDALGRSLVV